MQVRCCWNTTVYVGLGRFLRALLSPRALHVPSHDFNNQFMDITTTHKIHSRRLLETRSRNHKEIARSLTVECSSPVLFPVRTLESSSTVKSLNKWLQTTQRPRFAVVRLLPMICNPWIGAWRFADPRMGIMAVCLEETKFSYVYAIYRVPLLNWSGKVKRNESDKKILHQKGCGRHGGRLKHPCGIKSEHGALFPGASSSTCEDPCIICHVP